MDLQQILNLFLRSNPKWAKRIEGLTGQPVDYSVKCMNGFLEELNKGPGLKKPTDKLQEFNANYQMVLGLGGFQDYEAQILAADMSGFTLAEVTQHFRVHMGWDVTVDEVDAIHQKALPRFKEAGKRAGLFKEESIIDDPSIPNLSPNNSKNVNRNNGDSLSTPPWRMKVGNVTSNDNVASVQKDNTNSLNESCIINGGVHNGNVMNVNSNMIQER